MRFASSSGRLVCALLALAELCCGAGCEAMNELPPDSADQGGAGARTSRSAQSGVAGAGKNGAQAGSGGKRNQVNRASNAGRAAPSGAGAAAPPYIGDVPARAAGSGERPCGSSEFSAGPCGGRAASGPVAGRISASNTGTGGTRSEADSSDCKVIALPDSVRASFQLDPFYTKYANADGIPVLASDEPVDRSLKLACLLVKEMVSERQDVQAALLDSRVSCST